MIEKTKRYKWSTIETVQIVLIWTLNESHDCKLLILTEEFQADAKNELRTLSTFSSRGL